MNRLSRLVAQKALWLACGIAASVAAEPEGLTLAVGFDHPDRTAAWFQGQTGMAEGRRGQGLAAGQPTLGNEVAKGAYHGAEGTLMAWVKLVRRPPGGHVRRWTKILTANRVDLGVQGDAAAYAAYDQPAASGNAAMTRRARTLVETGDWRHWAFTWGGGRRLYLDGQLVLEAEQAPPFGQTARIDLVASEGGAEWVIDDVMMFDRALSAGEVRRAMGRTVVSDFAAGPSGTRAAGALAEAQDAPEVTRLAVAYDPAVQQVANPTAAGPDAAAGRAPIGWSVPRGKEEVRVSPGLLRVGPTRGEVVSILAQLSRGVVQPGRPYRIGLRYDLPSPDARVTLRFRNMIDRGTRSFPLPPTRGVERRFFVATAPEDYDVGLYYVETLVEGAGTSIDIRAAYCRPATEEEAAAAGLEPPAEQPLALRGRVVPDETWVQAAPGGLRFLDDAGRRAAWGLAAAPTDRPVTDLVFPLRAEGGSLLLEVPPRDLFDRLAALRRGQPGALPRLRVERVRRDVPGGYGLDPLPPRSAHGAALLFGVGAADNGTGAYAFRKLTGLLDELGVFDPDTRFLPFWAQKELYAGRAAADGAPRPPAPAGGLFVHTAPGVLCSGYLTPGGRLVLVLFNATAQELGKRGDLWIDHEKVFGKRWAVRNYHDARFTARDAESGIPAGPGWNRLPGKGGFVENVYPEIAIRPGDYRLLVVGEREASSP